MKTQPMAKGLRLMLTAAEARFVALALEEFATPATALIAAGIRRGLVEVDAKASADRSKRATDRARKAAEPKFRHFEIDGYHVSATQGDWYDASRDVDTRQWTRLRPDEPWRTIPAQCEHRPGWWMIFVWARDTLVQPEPLGDRLIEHLSSLEAVARTIIADSVLVPRTDEANAA